MKIFLFLKEIWYTGLRKISKSNEYLIALMIISFMFFVPFGSLIYIAAPKSKVKISVPFLQIYLFKIFKFVNLIKVGKFMHLPCIKFISFTISYIIFLVLIIATSLRLDYDFSTFIQFSKVYPDRVLNYTDYIKNEAISIRFIPTDFYLRSDSPVTLDLVVCIWLFGMNDCLFLF